MSQFLNGSTLSALDFDTLMPVDSMSAVPFADEKPEPHTTAPPKPENLESTFKATGQSSGTAKTAGGEEGLDRLSPEHIKRLRERGLDPRICAKLGFHTIDRKTLGHDYILRGKVHDTKLRRGKGKMPWERGPAKGRPLIAYNIDCLEPAPAPDEFLIITEGEFDTAACVQVGYPRCISVPNGAQQGDQGYSWLYPVKDLHPDVDKFATIVLALDNDKPGLDARDALATRLGDHRCKFLEYPKGCKDANDVLQQHGADKLREVIENARPMWVDELCRMSDIPDPGPVERYKLGIPEIDQHGFRITLPALWTIVGPYGSGKSVLLRQIAFNLWRHHNWPVFLTAFEDRAKPVMQRDFRRHMIGRGYMPDHKWTASEVAAADAEIDRAFDIFSRPKRKLLEPGLVLERLHLAVKRDGVKAFIIDPMNQIAMRTRPGQSKTDLLGEFLLSLKDMAEDYGLLGIVSAHVTKTALSDKSRWKQMPILRLEDAEETKAYGNMSDIGWAVWRLFNGPTIVHIDKLKDEETMGRRTLLELEMERAMNRFKVTRTGYDILKEASSGKTG